MRFKNQWIAILGLACSVTSWAATLSFYDEKTTKDPKTGEIVEVKNNLLTRGEIGTRHKALKGAVTDNDVRIQIQGWHNDVYLRTQGPAESADILLLLNSDALVDLKVISWAKGNSLFNALDRTFANQVGNSIDAMVTLSPEKFPQLKGPIPLREALALIKAEVAKKAADAGAKISESPQKKSVKH